MRPKKQAMLLQLKNRPLLNLLTMEQRGQLLTDLFEYADTGIRPEIVDPVLTTVFSMLQKELDEDTAKYIDKCMENSYKSYRAACKRTHVSPVEQDAWLRTEAAQKALSEYQTANNVLSPTGTHGYQQVPADTPYNTIQFNTIQYIEDGAAEDLPAAPPTDGGRY